MKAFHHPDEALHAPRFFLTRGTVRSNFEIPARAASLRAGLDALGLAPETTKPATREELLRLNTPDYLDFLEHAAAQWAGMPEAGLEVVANMHPTPEMLAQTQRKPAHVISRAGMHMADTACPIGPGTWTAAISAAGCALAAADVAAQSSDRGGGTAYALCRPPGHHAYASRAGGHCYVNNSALAAQRLRDSGAARVAVLDIDSHHGNGTQGIFWDRDDVLTVSIHGDPSRYYPWYVGFAEETGAANLNLPQEFGTGDEGWLAALDTAIAAVEKFRPDALVVPLGFDASEFEPLASLKVTQDGFARAGAAIGRLKLPTAICQEGGYNVDLLGTLLQRFLTGFGEAK
ncbi:MAG: acetylpolyamine aminohydrolase [Rubritepida sp.]|nr:acetylpolyamine aminohydrolase [Rubritepida sp.]